MSRSPLLALCLATLSPLCACDPAADKTTQRTSAQDSPKASEPTPEQPKTPTAAAPAAAKDVKQAQATQAAKAAADTGPVKAKQAVHNAGPRPLYYDRAITAEDLKGRSLRELTLMRNTIFARAGHKFRKPWLDEYFRSQAWYRPTDKRRDAEITAQDRKNVHIIAEAELKYDKSEIRARAKALAAKAAPTKAEYIEMRLASSRTGSWGGGKKVAKKDRSPLEDPTLLDELLKVEQLDKLSRRDLRLLRNTVYARRGRPFKSELLQYYFHGMDWYKEDPEFKKRMTKTDHRNIRMIRSVEKSLGGPLSDHEHKLEDGWFDMA